MRYPFKYPVKFYQITSISSFFGCVRIKDYPTSATLVPPNYYSSHYMKYEIFISKVVQGLFS